MKGELGEQQDIKSRLLRKKGKHKFFTISMISSGRYRVLLGIDVVELEEREVATLLAVVTWMKETIRYIDWYN